MTVRESIALTTRCEQGFVTADSTACSK